MSEPQSATAPVESALTSQRSEDDREKTTMISDHHTVKTEEDFSAARFEKLTGFEFAKTDPWLNPFEGMIRWYWEHFLNKIRAIDHMGGLDEFSEPDNWGWTVTSKEIIYYEWAPGPIDELCVVGDFNSWRHGEWCAHRDHYGHWKCVIPHMETEHGLVPRIPHGSVVKISIRSGRNTFMRLPQRTVATRQSKGNPWMDALFWNPGEGEKYVPKHCRPSIPKTLRIYECHVGMATEDGHIGTYREFARDVLPEVAAKGYNCVQIMAVQEHSYYASFGYQPTSPFAVASRSGTPEDFKYLVDIAHSLGILVIVDFVLGHCSRNVDDGLADWDGTSTFMFYSGLHPLWDAKVFDFGRVETTRYLLQSVRYWLRNYRIDGFRLDAVTSMLYEHRGAGVGFTGGYHEYFGPNARVSLEGLSFLRLASLTMHLEHPSVITIAEDVSGMPGLCRSVNEAGVGFDYRLAMAIPDLWTELMEKGPPDEDWDMGRISWIMTNRRRDEKVIAYTECHDQALVGSKTLSFWLMDADMYTHMTILVHPTQRIERGIALHKLMRLITIGLGGDGYLNFMGNEFGHPEWIDFPRQGNGWSCHYCRRQWHLEHDGLLRYQHLGSYDRALMNLEGRVSWNATTEYVEDKDNSRKMLVWNRGGLVFCVNLNPTTSFANYEIGVPKPGVWKIALCSDLIEYGGLNRVELDTEFVSCPTKCPEFMGQPHTIKIYIPSRVGIVFELVRPAEASADH